METERSNEEPDSFYVSDEEDIPTGIEGKQEIENLPDECDICASSYNLRTRKRIKCRYCGFFQCSECLKTNAFTNKTSVACLSCKKEMDDEYKIFTKKFVKTDLKDFQSDLLMEREMALLPSTAEIFEKYKEEKRCNAQIAELRKHVANLKLEIYNTNEQIAFLQQYRKGQNGVKKDSMTGNRCIKVGCNGFLSTQWKCCVCESWVCRSCHELKANREDANHVCNQDTIKTIEFLKAQQTKTCPNKSCGLSVQKINGCDHMFCIKCKTFFSWSTMKIINHVVSNPDYYAHMRRMGITPEASGARRNGNDGLQDGLCRDVLPNIAQVGYNTNVCLGRQRKGFKTPHISKILVIYHAFGHLYDFELERFRPPNIIEEHLALRLQYMEGLLTKDKWKMLLYRAEKKSLKIREIYSSLDGFIVLGCGFLTRYADILETESRKMGDKLNITVLEKEAKNAMENIEKCREGYNKTMEEVRRRFDCVVPFIDDKYRIESSSRSLTRLNL